MTKLAHDAVDYSEGKPHAHCSLCEHFIPAGPHCQIVADPIAPHMWCERFERSASAEIGYRLAEKDKHAARQ